MSVLGKLIGHIERGANLQFLVTASVTLVPGQLPRDLRIKERDALKVSPWLFSAPSIEYA